VEIRAGARLRFYCARVQRLSARSRSVGSVALIVLACVLAFVSVLTVWMRALVLNTDSYVRAVGPLIENPLLRDEVAQQVVNGLYAHVDVTRLLQDSLPDKARVLAPTLAQGIHDTAIGLAASALATSAVRRVWNDANRVAHDQVVRVLEGKGTVVTTARGEVAVDLRPIAEKVREALDRHGVRLFDNVSVSTLDQRFVLFRSVDLARVQRATRVLDDLGTWLPVTTFLAIGGAIAMAEHRRRTTGRVLLAMAATMVLLTIVIAVGRAYYLDRVGGEISRAAAAVPFDGLVRSLRFWVRFLFVVAVLGWLATWFAGSREMMAREQRARLALNRVTRAHARVLAGGGLVVAALALVVWDRPSPRTVLGVIVALALWEAAIQWVAREPGTRGLRS
jgi:hypothetical protein